MTAAKASEMAGRLPKRLILDSFCRLSDPRPARIALRNRAAGIRFLKIASRKTEIALRTGGTRGANSQFGPRPTHFRTAKSRFAPQLRQIQRAICRFWGAAGEGVSGILLFALRAPGTWTAKSRFAVQSCEIRGANSRSVPRKSKIRIVKACFGRGDSEILTQAARFAPRV